MHCTAPPVSHSVPPASISALPHTLVAVACVCVCGCENVVEEKMCVCESAHVGLND